MRVVSNAAPLERSRRIATARRSTVPRAVQRDFAAVDVESGTGLFRPYRFAYDANESTTAPDPSFEADQ